jgi:type III pantothenate kinase
MDETQDIMPSVLACDVGNSAIHFAHVKGESVTEPQVFRIGELAGIGKALAELWAAMPAPKTIVAASVNPAGLKALEAAVLESVAAPLLVIGRDLPLPIDTDLPHPEKTGVDRLCAAVAAYDRLGVACVVADFGTAITIDCVNDDGVFVGGAILPGLSTGAAGLHSGTAQLPLVDLEEPDWVYGKDTRQAIVGGLVFGARGALRLLVENYATELGHWPLVIVTGGDARLVCPDVGQQELVQAIVPDLVIRGIAAAYYRTLVK